MVSWKSTDYNWSLFKTTIMNHLLCIHLSEMYIKHGKISAGLEHQTRGLLENMKSTVVYALFQGMAGILVPLSTLVVYEYFV